jgi:glutamate-1-semialdehyde 2,1-aminomutase
LESEFKNIGWHEGYKDKKYPQNVQEKLSQKEIDQVLYEHLKKNIDTIDFVQVTGGEPLINKKFLEFLEWCVEHKHSNRIVILITTNGMNIQKERLSILKQFKYSIISFSIDGYGALDEYIRYPTRWDHKIKNMFWLKENVDEFVVTSVIYNLNVLGLYELTKWLDENYIKHLFYPLEEPNFLHCKNLPTKLKTIAIERIKKIRKFSNVNKDGVESILNSLDKPISTNEWEKTKNQILIYKTHRNLDILNYCKEFKDFI